MSVAPNAILDAIVLAFSKSALREIVGTDALRTALAGLSKEMLSPGKLELQPLWKLLEEQPGFVKNDAAPPVLLLKTWEAKLELTVVLPEAFGDVRPEDCERYAQTLTVEPAELQRVLSPPPPPPATTPPIASGRDPATTADPRPASNTGRPKSRTMQPLQVIATSGPRRFPWTIAVAVVVLIGVIVLRFVLREPSTTVTLAASDVSTEIPLASVRQNEKMIVAMLRERSWLDQPDDVRRKQLEEAFVKARGLEATAINIFDNTGMLVASASIAKGRTVVAFPGANKPKK